MIGGIGHVLARTATALCILGFLSPVAAAPTEWKCNAITAIPPDERIAACTAVIDAGKYGKQSLILAHYHRAHAYMMKHEFEHAAADFGAQLELTPKNFFIYAFRAYVHFQAGDYDRAIADYGRTIELNPRSRYAYFGRGVAYYRKGDYEHAIADYTEAMQLGHQDRQASGDRSAQAGHPEEEPPPPPVDGQSNRAPYSDWYALYARGAAYLGKEDLDRAIADYSDAIRLNPRDKNSLVHRSSAFMRKGDLDRAIADCDRVVQLDPQYVWGYRARALANWQRGSFSKSLPDLDQAARLDPKNAYVALRREIVARRSDQPSQLTEAAMQLDMTKWPAPIVKLFLGTSTPEQVLAAADDSDPKKKQGQVCEANFYTAEFAFQRGDREDAQRLFELAAADCPTTFVETPVARAELKAMKQNP